MQTVLNHFILKELPVLIITLQSIYDEYGHAEAYVLALTLRSYSGVATIFLLFAVKAQLLHVEEDNLTLAGYQPSWMTF